MGRLIPESDWKYMRKIKNDLLNSLCERINKQSISLLKGHGSEHEKYMNHYNHLQDSDRIVAECFDDWRRSTLIGRLSKLLQTHVENYAPGVFPCAV